MFDLKEYTDEIISRFPHMYNRDVDSNNYFLLSLYLDEINKVSKCLADMLKSLNILKAKNYELDYFGTIFRISRKKNEIDNIYRQRILAEILKQSKNATVETILNIFKIIIENFKENIFVYEEGIKKSNKGNINKEVYNGSFKGNADLQKYEIKGGSLYFVINKRLPLSIRKNILDVLLEIRAKGVEVTVDFKYKVQVANYISNGVCMNMKRILYVKDKFFDEIQQQKSYESNLAKINIITQEGVR